MTDRERALWKLQTLGFKGDEIYLADLIPAVEMAWADGAVGPNELAILEAYCETLVDSLNAQAGAKLFHVGRALRRMKALLARRLTPAERQLALEALRDLTGGRLGHQRRQRMVEWAEAVAAVDGSPVWDTRELFWLQRVRTVLELH